MKLKAANPRRIEPKSKKSSASRFQTPGRFQLDAPPISMAALLKASRLGMAWTMAILLCATLVQASSVPNAGIKAIRARAEAGEPEAEYRLGRMLEFGDGVRVNSVQAAMWYRKAAKQGLPQAQYSLARMYQAGEGVKPDGAKAVSWLRSSASAKYPLALNRLGVMCERGEGLPEDHVEAYKWYSLAAQAGLISGVVNRDNLKARMSSEQIARAERLVKPNSFATFPAQKQD